MAQHTAIRDPRRDQLLTPSNAAFAFVDYQPEQFTGVMSSGRDELMLNLLTLGRAARAWSMPVVLTTVGVELGVNHGTEPELRELLAGVPEIDRTSLNAWEDRDFRAAIEATARKKIILAGLWTEVCVAFPALDMLREDYEIYVVADAIGGVSNASHERAMQRMIQAGAEPVTALAVACELQRDWGRPDADDLRQIARWYFPAMRRLHPAGRASR